MSLKAADREHARRRVRVLAASRVVSAGGSQAAELALIYEIYAITKSGLWVAAALFGSVSLSGLLGPLSGWTADRFDRRRVMISSELSAGAVYAGMAFAHRDWVLLLGAFAATTLGSPFRAASAAAIPNLVDRESLAWANAQLGAAFNAALVAGPLVGGALLAISGSGLVFDVNAATYVVSAALIASTSGEFGGRRALAKIEHGLSRDLLAGFKFIVSNKRLAPLAAASALAYGSFGAALVIDPALSRYFHAGSVGFGLLTTVWGAGAVVGAVVAGRVVSVATAHKAVLAGMAAMALSLGSVAVLPTFGLIVAAGALGGGGSGFVFVPWLVLIQHHTTDLLRGRVVAAAETFDQTAFVCGMGAAVPAIALLNPHHAYLVTGVLLVAATVMAGITRTGQPGVELEASLG
jgi:MFS family permease